ncbi:LacI family DNA-binding transcriptional regulator, partial [Bombella apis]|uniref:LacI family DNA-binding transcriptional regulator n=1 Tax=Bombella apis TaxID=1785988 RepID=UPI0038D1B30F
MVVRYLDDGRRVGSLLSWVGIRGLALTYVTIRDVAERAGVSPTTVSQILHGKGRFSSKTRKFVL